jgi:Fe-S oxidoreductase
VPGFDYSAYFHRVQDMKKLQVLRSDVSWLERYETPTEHHDTLLYLGCNILRTPHIAKQVVRVFEHLGLDFVAVGGIQYCCGIAWEAGKDVEKGQGVSKRTIGRMESHRPSRVIMWCPSCNVHFTDIVMGRDEQRPDFAITHTPNFLAELAQSPEGLPWRQEVPERVVVHAHAGRTDHPEGRRRAREDREAVLALLQAVPGLEVIDVIVSEPEMDYDCGGASQKLPMEVFRGHQRATLERALELGAEKVVTISHACQREWCGENTGRLGFRNYISIVAEALGLPVEPDILTMFRDGRSTEEILEMSRTAWVSHGMTEDEAREMVRKYVESGDLTGFSAGVASAS